MRKILTVLAVLSSLWAHAAAAQSGPVVVELFTSQGCSSCPPADAILTDLAKRDDVIALALHVDYWDYLGWKDAFADNAYSRRQRAYAQATGKHTVYTPQVIVQGFSTAVGNQLNDIRQAIDFHRKDTSTVVLTVLRQGGQAVITARALNGNVGRAVIQLVRYVPEEKVQIRAGENAGRQITYSNIVTNWTPVTRWNGRDDITVRSALGGSDLAVVLVQTDGFGPILAAARLP